MDEMKDVVPENDAIEEVADTVHPTVSYMDDLGIGNPSGENIEEPEVTKDNIVYKEVKILKLFKKLPDYVSALIKSIFMLEVDQLSTTQVSTVNEIYKTLIKQKEDLIFYLENNFEINDYVKNLYVYTLHKAALSESLENLRKTLELKPEI